MKIAILSRNSNLYSTRRLVEASEARGHEVVVIDHLECMIELEKKNPKIFYKGIYLDDFDAVIPRIGASVTFYGTAVVRQFEMMKVFTSFASFVTTVFGNPTPALVNICKLRSLSLERTNSCDSTAVKTFIISN